MIHPCSICPDGKGDKRTTTCRDCQKRIDYDDYTSGRIDFVPDSLKDCTQPPKSIAEKAAQSNEKTDSIDILPGRALLGVVPTAAAAASKTCSLCGRSKPLDEFGKHAKTADGHAHICKACHSKQMKKGHRKSKPPAPESKAKSKSEDIKTKTCTRCAKTKPLSEFNSHATTADGLMHICRDCQCAVRQNRPAVKTRRYDVRLDFSRFPDLYVKLRECADEALRSPDMQALHILRYALESGEAFQRKYN